MDAARLFSNREIFMTDFPKTAAAWTRLKAAWTDYREAKRQQRLTKRRLRATYMLLAMQRAWPKEHDGDLAVHIMIGALAKTITGAENQ